MTATAVIMQGIAVALIFLALFGAISAHSAIIGLAVVYLPGLMLGLWEGFWKGINS